MRFAMFLVRRSSWNSWSGLIRWSSTEVENISHNHDSVKGYKDSSVSQKWFIQAPFSLSRQDLQDILCQSHPSIHDLKPLFIFPFEFDGSWVATANDKNPLKIPSDYKHIINVRYFRQNFRQNLPAVEKEISIYKGRVIRAEHLSTSPAEIQDMFHPIRLSNIIFYDKFKPVALLFFMSEADAYRALIEFLPHTPSTSFYLLP
jgi:hypothetical protein